MVELRLANPDIEGLEKLNGVPLVTKVAEDQAFEVPSLVDLLVLTVTKLPASAGTWV
jgi:hypothetical protein